MGGVLLKWKKFSLMITAIIFILILGLLIFVHELGHFLTARRNGIKADEFGFGFPPRILGFVKHEITGKYKIVWGGKEVQSKNTIYSLNWIPLGGFVKIKGEEGEAKNDSDSFAEKKAWVRSKVLVAGVLMNFILAWVLISLAFMIGAPEATDPGELAGKDAKIQIAATVPDSPAEAVGLSTGDEILKDQGEISIQGIKSVQDYINSKKGQELTLNIKRGKDILNIKVTPRENFPKDQGPLGISLVQTKIVKYPWYQAIIKALDMVFSLIIAMFSALGLILKSLFVGQSAGIDVAGPVGIAVLTKQAATLGFVYILQFAALLSINLGIINILPIPALDGGRVLFILIEKIKGSPVSQKVEQIFHTIGFTVLIMLMVLVTLRDVLKFFT